MINWKVRVKNKAFWLAFIPAVLLLAQSAAEAFGYTLAVNELSERILGMVNQLFALLAILGVVNDPTTAGLSDSQRAMGYEKPV